MIELPQIRTPRVTSSVISVGSCTPTDGCLEKDKNQRLALSTQVLTIDENKGVKKKQKTIEDLLGIPKEKNTKNTKKGGGRKKQKCVVFRAAAAAAALSVSSEDIRNRNRLIRLDAAQAAWTVTKIIGPDYMGNEEEVVSKIMVMEEQDEVRAAQLIPKLN
ncbi:hypothetical protein RHMOL_Rhmol13G0288800 [Rhododendron molle]|uniref:Uncharacterized protein n=1 Tax=Rhododendron molle TaxID=49168 RepID=A0ACC0LDF8_RHOML|nr:hypothetical protein RHMOL_Rhmol13G0288800 [Rhododendron molle]